MSVMSNRLVPRSHHTSLVMYGEEDMDSRSSIYPIASSLSSSSCFGSPSASSYSLARPLRAKTTNHNVRPASSPSARGFSSLSSSMVFGGRASSKKTRNTSCSFALPSASASGSSLSSYRQESSPRNRSYAAMGSSATTCRYEMGSGTGSSVPPIWSAKEHGRFLSGLEQFAYGQCSNAHAIWYAIAAKVETRSIEEVKAHANRYFLQLQLVNSRNQSQSRQREMDTSSRLRVVQDSRWTRAEDELFEDLLALYVDHLVLPWEKLATRFPDKTPRELQERYHKLCYDISLIESGEHVVMKLNANTKSSTSSLDHYQQQNKLPQQLDKNRDPVGLDAVVTLTPEEEENMGRALEETPVPCGAVPEFLAALASAMTCLSNSTNKIPPQRRRPAFGKTDAQRVLHKIFQHFNQKGHQDNASFVMSSSRMAHAIVIKVINDLDLFPNAPACLKSSREFPRRHNEAPEEQVDQEETKAVHLDRRMPLPRRFVREHDDASPRPSTSMTSDSTLLMTRPQFMHQDRGPVLSTSRRQFQPSQSGLSRGTSHHINRPRVSDSHVLSGHHRSYRSSVSHSAQPVVVSGVARDRLASGSREDHSTSRSHPTARRFRVDSPGSSPTSSIASRTSRTNGIGSLSSRKMSPRRYVTASGHEDYL